MRDTRDRPRCRVRCLVFSDTSWPASHSAASAGRQYLCWPARRRSRNTWRRPWLATSARMSSSVRVSPPLKAGGVAPGAAQRAPVRRTNTVGGPTRVDSACSEGRSSVTGARPSPAPFRQRTWISACSGAGGRPERRCSRIAPTWRGRVRLARRRRSWPGTAGQAEHGVGGATFSWGLVHHRLEMAIRTGDVAGALAVQGVAGPEVGAGRSCLPGSG